MPHDIVVIGASAGGVEALTHVVESLPAGLPAAIFLVLHVGKTRSALPEILSRHSRIPVIHAMDEAPIVPGRIAVAPPDAHLVLERDLMRLSHAPEENGCRPAIDPLFRSAARVFGRRVVGVILTGALDDGVAGLVAIHRAGGIAIVQDPDDAAMPSMPRTALRYVDADYVVPLREIAGLVSELARQVGPEVSGPYPAGQPADEEGDVQPGSEERSALTCPACSGALHEVRRGGLLQFRCRVGHVYSADSMLAEQAEAVDRALWAAVRALEERAALQKRVASMAESRGQETVATQFRQRAERTQTHAATLRGLVFDATAAVGPGEGAESAPELTTRDSDL